MSKRSKGLALVALAFLCETCARHASEQVLTASAEPTPSLVEELAMIDRAHRALADGDSATTTKLVDAYELRYPSGTFSQEADVLRIEALLSQDDMDEAARRVRRFLEANPNSPHTQRLRELLARDSID